MMESRRSTLFREATLLLGGFEAIQDLHSVLTYDLQTLYVGESVNDITWTLQIIA